MKHLNNPRLIPIYVLLIITALLLINSDCDAQYKLKIKEHLLPASLVLLAGASDGLNQVLAYQYPSFKKAFPKSNDQYWSKEISFKNKYKNGDPKQGAKFPGSTGPLVFLTDGYHLTRFTERLFLSGAFAVKVGQSKKKWYWYLAEAAGYWLVNRVGFCLVYNQFK